MATAIGLLGITLVDVLLVGMLGIWFSAKTLDSHKAGQRLTVTLGLLYFAGPAFDIALSVMMRGGDKFIGSIFSPIMATFILMWEADEVLIWAGHLALFFGLAVFLLWRFPKMARTVLVR